MKLFQMAINKSNGGQSFSDNFGETVSVPPNWAVDVSFTRGKPLAMRDIDSFIKHLRKKNIKKFYIKRSFAFGDILMLVPVVNYLRELGFEPCVFVKWKYVDVMNLLGMKAYELDGIESFFETPGDYGILLDGTLELDHVRPKLQKASRVGLYFSALGIYDFPKEVRWDCDLGKFPGVETKFKKYVVFQSKGSTGAKTLPSETAIHIIKRLNEEGINVVFIGDKVGGMSQNVNMKRTDLAHFRYSAEEIFTVIGKAQCVISMDSAPLWISHFTKTPLIAILGPTSSKVRLNYHPLLPDGVENLQLNEDVGCDCCFEKAEACNWKYTCLQLDKEKFFKRIYNKIGRFIEND